LGKLTKFIVPKGKQIRKVETVFAKQYGTLYGFKWFDDDGEVLLAVGHIDHPNYRSDT
jgi:hypothetical protein